MLNAADIYNMCVISTVQFSSAKEHYNRPILILLYECTHERARNRHFS